jgi:acetyl esterase/lipase
MKTGWLLGTLFTAALFTRAQGPARQAELPEGVKALRDVAYVENGHARQKLDLYVPEQATNALPVIIWIHGGGWKNGSKEGCPPLRQGFLSRGYAVASLNYRLSGDAIFPAQIEDCKAAVRWLRVNAKQYGLNPDRFGVWGSSAGGHLVALLGTSGDEKAFDVGANLGVSSRVQAVCDYYGPSDLLQMDSHAPGGARLKHDAPDSPEAALIGGPVQENREKAARVNPITYIATNALPPFLIVHGDADPVVPYHQSELLFEALKKAGGNVHLHRIIGAEHGKGFGGKEITERVTAFFDSWLKAPGPVVVAAAAKQTESLAVDDQGMGNGARNRQQGRGPQQGGPRITFEQVKAREDADGDGRVTREEFKGPQPMFQRLDRNGDGALTAEDFGEKP